MAGAQGDRARPDAGAPAWPPLVATVLAFGLAIAVLPNPLRTPQNHPGALAELAPVPGDAVIAPGNVSEFGSAGSPGLGSGNEPPPVTGPLLAGREVPVDKECVGDPPRQTEDRLSPPCVPYFSGDNGGATARAVTGETIDVIFYNDYGVDADMNAQYRPEDERGSNGAPWETANLVRTIKTQLRYFQHRFQTYGRTVRVFAMSSSRTGGSGTSEGTITESSRRADALRSVAKNPFAAVYLGDGAGHYFAELARGGVPSFGLNYDVPRSFYERHDPYIWSFMSDQETQGSWSASFICRVLRPGVLPARFSPDPALATQPRRLGLVYARGRSVELDRMPGVLRREVERQCGSRFAVVEPFAGTGASAAPRIVAQLRSEGVTTVVCYCVGPDGQVSSFQSTASGAAYRPEWFWDHASAMDRPQWQKTFGAKDQTSFGVSYFWRQPKVREQMWHRAYAEQAGDGSTPNVRFNFAIYMTFLNLFTAIQAAGPILTVPNAARGMLTFRYLDPSDPMLPTGGYGPGGPGSHTFIDTAVAWWWDPAGTPPGRTEPEGCIRLGYDGVRFAGPEGAAAGIAPPWPRGDAIVAAARDRGTCTEDVWKIDPSSVPGA